MEWGMVVSQRGDVSLKDNIIHIPVELFLAWA